MFTSVCSFPLTIHIFLYRIKYCRAINILFSYFPIRFRVSLQKNVHVASKKNMRIKSMNQILIRLLQMMHFKSLNYVLKETITHYTPSTSRTNNKKTKIKREKSRRFVCKIVDNIKSPFQLIAFVCTGAAHKTCESDQV